MPVNRSSILAIALLAASPALAQNAKVSTLIPVTTPLTGSELFYVVQGATSKNMTFLSLQQALAATTVVSPVVNAAAAPYNVVNDPTCAQNQLSRLQAFATAAAGLHGVLPNGALICIASTWQIGVGFDLDMNNATIRFNATAGSPVAPAIDVQQTVAAWSMHIHGGTVDGNSQGSTGTHYTDSTYFGATQPFGDVTLVWEADGVDLHDMIGINGFDNCFGIAAITGGSAVTGRPSRGNIYNISGGNCGVGYHHTSGGAAIAGQQGGLLDDGSGSGLVINNVVDNQSFNCIIDDIGGGSYASWSNVTCLSTKVDSVNPTNGSGLGVYVGSPLSSFNNISIISPAKGGIWADFFSGDVANGEAGTNFSNVIVKSPQTYCVLIKAAGNWNGLQCLDASAEGNNIESGVDIDLTGGNISPLMMTGVSFTHTPGQPEQAFAFHANGSNTLQGVAIAGTLIGVSGSTLNIPAGFSIISTSPSGLGFGNASASVPWDFLGQTKVSVAANTIGFEVTASSNGNCFLFKPESSANIGQLAYAEACDGTFGTLALLGLVQMPNLPTSAGGGGLFVCIDTAGNEYKKSTCP